MKLKRLALVVNTRNRQLPILHGKNNICRAAVRQYEACHTGRKGVKIRSRHRIRKRLGKYLVCSQREKFLLGFNGSRALKSNVNGERCQIC